jgi:competence protein ComFC
MIEKRVGNIDVISFFDYYLVSELVKSKYIISGYRFYKFVAKRFFQPFIKAYVSSYKDKKIYIIGVDENVIRGYSNIALLTHYGSKNSGAKALHNVLKASNSIKYAGKSLEYRLKNPRDFKYLGPKNIDVILIDDVVTTGTTLQEASIVLKNSGVNIHFALTVANAEDGIDY